MHLHLTRWLNVLVNIFCRKIVVKNPNVRFYRREYLLTPQSELILCIHTLFLINSTQICVLALWSGLWDVDISLGFLWIPQLGLIWERSFLPHGNQQILPRAFPTAKNLQLDQSLFENMIFIWKMKIWKYGWGVFLSRVGRMRRGTGVGTAPWTPPGVRMEVSTCGVTLAMARDWPRTSPGDDSGLGLDSMLFVGPFQIPSSHEILCPHLMDSGCPRTGFDAMLG